jgi:tape measure domain-containing protein
MSIGIEFETRSDKAQKDLNAINNSLKNIENTTGKASAALGNAFRALGAMATIGGTALYLKNVSTQFSELSNKIAVVTGRTNALVKTQKELYAIATKTGSSLSSVAETFGSFGRSTKNMDIPLRKLLTVTETIQKALTLTGSNNESGAQALFQLGQGLASGTLRGQELNSVLEQAPRIAQAISDELGVTLGQLRSMGEAGKITSKVVFSAMLNQTKKINEEFKDINFTISQTMGSLSDAVKIFVSELDKGLGISSGLGNTFFKMANHIRLASDGAAEMGYNFKESFKTMKANVALIAGPMLSIIRKLGSQLLTAMPTHIFHRTLIKDWNAGLAALDRSTGGWLQKWKLFKFSDIIRIESPIEVALRKLRRLSNPNKQVGGFLNVKFDSKRLHDYSRLLGDLADATGKNSSTLGVTLTTMMLKVDHAFRNVFHYFSRNKFTFTFNKGNIEGFLMSLSEMTRGITGVHRGWLDFKTHIVTIFAPAIYSLGIAFKDVSKAIPTYLDYLKKSAIEFYDIFIRNFKGIAAELIRVSTVWRSAFVSMLMAFYEFEKSIWDKTGLSDYLKWELKLTKELLSKITNAFVTSDFGSAAIRVFKNTVKAIEKLYTDLHKVFDKKMHRVNFSSVADSFDDFFNNLKHVNDKTKGISKIFRVLEERLVLARHRIVDAFSSLYSDLQKALNKPFRAIDFGDVLASLTMFLNRIYHAFDKNKPFTDSLSSIKKFAKGVINEFYTIWDKVIGHSYWTDTIESIKKTSRDLASSVGPVLASFGDKVIGVFRKVHAQVDSILTRVKNKLADVFDKNNIVLPTFKIDKKLDFKTNFNNIIKDFKNSFVIISHELPEIFKVALASMAAMVVMMLVPPGKLKIALLSEFLSTVAVSGTIVAEAFGKALTGGSLVYTVGRAFGRLVGIIVGSVIYDIPFILNSVLGLIAGFGRGLAEELTMQWGSFGKMIQKVIKAAFSVSDVVGGMATGTLGLLGAYLFGTSVLKVLSALGIYKKEIKGIGGIFTSLASVIMGTSKNPGFVERMLFGRMGVMKSLSLIGLVAQYAGVFDSVVGEATTMNGAALTTALFAGLWKGDKIVEGFKTKIINPIILAVKGLLSKMNALLGGQSLPVALFSPTGPNMSTFAALSAIYNTGLTLVADKIRPYAAKVSASIMGALFGSNAQLNRQMMWWEIKDAFTEVWASIKGMFAGSGGGGLFSSVRTQLTTFFTWAGGLFTKFTSFIGNLFGTQGLLPRIFMGIGGKTAVKAAIYAGIAAAVLAVGSVAFGAEDKPVKTHADTVNERLDKAKEKKNYWRPYPINQDVETWVSNNPIKTALAFATAALGAFVALSSKARAAITNAFANGLPSANMQNFAKGFAVVGSMAAAFFLGNFLAKFTGNEDMAMEFGLMATMLVGSMASSISKAVPGLLKSVGGFLATELLIGTLSIPVWIAGTLAAIAAAGVGALGIFLFGKEGDFGKDFKNLTKRVKNWVTQTNEKDIKSSITGLTQGQNKSARELGIDLEFDVSTIDTKKLSKVEKEKLTTLETEFGKVIDSAKFEKIIKGRLEGATLIAIESKYDELKKYVDFLGKSDFNFIDSLKSTDTMNPTSKADRFSYWLKEIRLKRSYNLQMDELELQRSGIERYHQLNSLESSEKYAEKMARINMKISDLMKQKDTDYSAYKRGTTPQEQRVAYKAFSLKDATMPSSMADNYDKQSRRVATLRYERNQSEQLGNNFAELPQRNLKEIDKDLTEAMDSWERLADRVNTYQLHLNDVDIFTKSVANMASTFKEAGVAFEENAVFAKDGAAYERIKMLQGEATVLASDLKNAKSIADKQTIFWRQEVITNEIVRIKLEADTTSPFRKQFLLADITGAADMLEGISKKTFETLSDDASKALFDQVTKIRVAQKALEILPEQDPNKILTAQADILEKVVKLEKELTGLRKKRLESAAGSGYFDSRQATPEDVYNGRLGSLFGSQPEATDKQRADAIAQKEIERKIWVEAGRKQFVYNEGKPETIQADYKAAVDKIQQDKWTANNLLYSGLRDQKNGYGLKELAANVGTDLPAMIRTYGTQIDVLTEKLIEMNKKKNDIDFFLSQNMFTEANTNAKYLEQFAKDANRQADTLSNVVSTATSFNGNSISEANIENMDPKILSGLYEQVHNFNIAFDRELGSGGAAIADYLKKRKAISKKISDADYAATNTEDPNTRYRLLTDMGLAPNQIARMEPLVRTNIAQLQKVAKKAIDDRAKGHWRGGDKKYDDVVRAPGDAMRAYSIEEKATIPSLQQQNLVDAGLTMRETLRVSDNLKEQFIEVTSAKQRMDDAFAENPTNVDPTEKANVYLRYEQVFNRVKDSVKTFMDKLADLNDTLGINISDKNFMGLGAIGDKLVDIVYTVKSRMAELLKDKPKELFETMTKFKVLGTRFQFIEDLSTLLADAMTQSVAKGFDNAGKYMADFDFTEFSKLDSGFQKELKGRSTNSEIVDKVKNLNMGEADKQNPVWQQILEAYKHPMDYANEKYIAGLAQSSEFLQKYLADAVPMQEQLVNSNNLLRGAIDWLTQTITKSFPTLFDQSDTLTDGQGYATGGRVSGRGTGTSDSINAKLSNGEFVVNADSTKKYRPLIDAINSGNITGFAGGRNPYSLDKPVGSMSSKYNRWDNSTSRKLLEQNIFEEARTTLAELKGLDISKLKGAAFDNYATKISTFQQDLVTALNGNFHEIAGFNDYGFDPSTKSIYGASLKDSINAKNTLMSNFHEIGHFIDQTAKQTTFIEKNPNPSSWTTKQKSNFDKLTNLNSRNTFDGIFKSESTANRFAEDLYSAIHPEIPLDKSFLGNSFDTYEAVFRQQSPNATAADILAGEQLQRKSLYRVAELSRIPDANIVSRMSMDKVSEHYKDIFSGERMQHSDTIFGQGKLADDVLDNYIKTGTLNDANVMSLDLRPKNLTEDFSKLLRQEVAPNAYDYLTEGSVGKLPRAIRNAMVDVSNSDIVNKLYDAKGKLTASSVFSSMDDGNLFELGKGYPFGTSSIDTRDLGIRFNKDNYYRVLGDEGLFDYFKNKGSLLPGPYFDGTNSVHYSKGRPLGYYDQSKFPAYADVGSGYGKILELDDIKEKWQGVTKEGTGYQGHINRASSKSVNIPLIGGGKHELIQMPRDFAKVEEIGNLIKSGDLNNLPDILEFLGGDPNAGRDIYKQFDVFKGKARDILKQISVKGVLSGAKNIATGVAGGLGADTFVRNNLNLTGTGNAAEEIVASTDNPYSVLNSAFVAFSKTVDIINKELIAAVAGGGSATLISKIPNPYVKIAAILGSLSVAAWQGFQPQKKATGGVLSGPGTGTSDSIPAMLSNGEFVVNAKSTSRYRDLLHAINKGEIAGFATGGLNSNIQNFQNLGTTFSDIDRRGASSRKAVQLKVQALGLSIDMSQLNEMNDKYLKMFNNYLEQIKEYEIAAASASAENKAIMNVKLREFYDTIDKMKDASFANKAGEAFSSNFHSNFKTGMLNAMKTGDWSGFAKGVSNNFMDQMNSTFIDGLMEPITGPNGFMGKMMKGLGESVSKTGAGLGGILATPGNAAVDMTMMPSTTFFGTCVDRFSLAVSNFGMKFDLSKPGERGTGLSGTSAPLPGSDGTFAPQLDTLSSGGITLGNATNSDPFGTPAPIVDKSNLQATINQTSTMGDLFNKSNLTYLAGAGMIVAALAGGMSGGKMDWIAAGLAIAGAVVSVVGAGVNAANSSSASSGSSKVGQGFMGPTTSARVGAAEGGLLSGPGTGTSDSILARLSNGEFVVNAGATAKNIGLLTRINSGTKFAAGGLAGTLDMPLNNSSLTKGATTASNQSTININVTGDISRQTRSEIMKMIPNISSGVNMYNKEHAY